MSWYTDHQLFITLGTDSNFYVRRITKQFDINPITLSEFHSAELLSFSKHLSLGDNKESDYSAFKAAFDIPTRLYKFVNSQGYLVNWNSPIGTGTWSRAEQNSPFWSLPGITEQKSVTEKTVSSLEEENKKIKKEKEALDKRVLDLEVEFNRERDERSALINGLQQQVRELTSKLQCCGAAGSSIEEPWISRQTVPSNWVPFGDLDVQPFSKNIPLIITKTTGGLKFGVDNTTNVQANRFYGGIFPIVVVDVAELTPNREEARFDPDVWSCCNNAGISYAARKPFPSEM